MDELVRVQKYVTAFEETHHDCEAVHTTAARVGGLTAAEIKLGGDRQR
jgi:hypothetical protein